jgi:Zn-dependent metalloprotease
MTIQYKNAGFSLDTTSVKTLFTCPTSGVAIIKSILIANDHSSDVAVKAALNDGTTYQFYQKTLTSDSSDDAVSGVLNLEAGRS